MVEIGDLLLSNLKFHRKYLVLAIKKYALRDVNNREFEFLLYDLETKRNYLRVKYRQYTWKEWMAIYGTRVIRHGKDISDSICNQLDDGEQR